MKKKLLISICVILIIVIVCVIILINTSFYKMHKANLIFGSELCDKNENDHQLLSLPVISTYKCRICEKEIRYGSSPTPKICENCSHITNRCKRCGKLEKD